LNNNSRLFKLKVIENDLTEERVDLFLAMSPSKDFIDEPDFPH